MCDCREAGRTGRRPADRFRDWLFRALLLRCGYPALPLADVDSFLQSDFGFLGSQKGRLFRERGGVGPGAGEWPSSAEGPGGPGRHPQARALCLSEVGWSGVVAPKEEGASGNTTWRGACTERWDAGADPPFWGFGAAAFSSYLPRSLPPPHTPHSSLAQPVRPRLRFQVPILTRKKPRSRHRRSSARQGHLAAKKWQNALCPLAPLDSLSLSTPLFPVEGHRPKRPPAA